MTEDVPGYQVLEQVGEGGFSVVYRAVQERLDRVVALKVMSIGTVDDTAMRRFQRECKITGRLSGHPNVVTVLDTGTTRADRPYIAMEYFEHGALADRLVREGPLPVAEVLRIGVKLASALAATHEADVLHRDVKPQNVLVSRYGEPALTDFGIARLVDNLDATNSQAFTPHHAAPEVLESRPAVVGTDLYSLGSTLYQLLAGRPAFKGPAGEGIAQLMLRILNDEPPPLRRTDVPDPVFAAITHAMAKEPEHRYADAVGFARRLQEVQGELGFPVTDLTHSGGGGPAPLRATGPHTGEPSTDRTPKDPAPRGRSSTGGSSTGGSATGGLLMGRRPASGPPMGGAGPTGADGAGADETSADGNWAGADGTTGDRSARRGDPRPPVPAWAPPTAQASLPPVAPLRTPGTPEAPGTPETPSTSETPGTPETPSVPEMPSVPETPAVPGASGMPEAPSTPPSSPRKPEPSPLHPDTAAEAPQPFRHHAAAPAPPAPASPVPVPPAHVPAPPAPAPAAPAPHGQRGHGQGNGHWPSDQRGQRESHWEQWQRDQRAPAGDASGPGGTRRGPIVIAAVALVGGLSLGIGALAMSGGDEGDGKEAGARPSTPTSKPATTPPPTAPASTAAPGGETAAPITGAQLDAARPRKVTARHAGARVAVLWTLPRAARDLPLIVQRLPRGQTEFVSVEAGSRSANLSGTDPRVRYCFQVGAVLRLNPGPGRSADIAWSGRACTRPATQAG